MEHEQCHMKTNKHNRKVPARMQKCRTQQTVILMETLSTLYRSTGLSTLVVLVSVSRSSLLSCFSLSCGSDCAVGSESLFAELTSALFTFGPESGIKMSISNLLRARGGGGGCKMI